MARAPMRWTKPRGSSRLRSVPRTCELRQSGKVLVELQEMNGLASDDWFWCAVDSSLPPKNTSSEPPLSLDDAKAAALAFVRAALPPAGGR